MKRMLCNGGAALLLLVSVAGLLGPGGDEEGEKKPVEPLPPHARAPHGVVLTVDKPDKQLAWVKDIDREARGPQVILSRSDAKMVENTDDRAARRADSINIIRFGIANQATIQK